MAGRAVLAPKSTNQYLHYLSGAAFGRRAKSLELLECGTERERTIRDGIWQKTSYVELLSFGTATVQRAKCLRV